jgi:transcriptional regulator with XRE-family HTH domain
MTMRDTKRKRLEAKGWRVGSTAEFLGLSPEESAFIELKLRLATDLRAHRRQRRLTQWDLARLVSSSQSRVAKMEAGDPTVSLDLLVRTLLALGVSSREIARAIAPRRAEELLRDTGLPALQRRRTRTRLNARTRNPASSDRKTDRGRRRQPNQCSTGCDRNSSIGIPSAPTKSTRRG